MIRVSARLAVLVSLSVVSVVTVVRAQPTADDLTGNWKYTSFLLDPSSRFPHPSEPRVELSTGQVWASGNLELQEEAGGSLTGALKLDPKGLPLKISGRRIRGEGDLASAPDAIELKGVGTIPAMPDATPPTPAIPLEYELYGHIAPNPNGDGISIRGTIRALKFDPYYPDKKFKVGAFVLIPQGVELKTIAPQP